MRSDAAHTQGSLGCRHGCSELLASGEVQPWLVLVRCCVQGGFVQQRYDRCLVLHLSDGRAFWPAVLGGLEGDVSRSC